MNPTVQHGNQGPVSFWPQSIDKWVATGAISSQQATHMKASLSTHLSPFLLQFSPSILSPQQVESITALESKNILDAYNPTTQPSSSSSSSRSSSLMSIALTIAGVAVSIIAIITFFILTYDSLSDETRSLISFVLAIATAVVPRILQSKPLITGLLDVLATAFVIAGEIYMMIIIDDDTTMCIVLYALALVPLVLVVGGAQPLISMLLASGILLFNGIIIMVLDIQLGINLYIPVHLALRLMAALPPQWIHRDTSSLKAEWSRTRSVHSSVLRILSPLVLLIVWVCSIEQSIQLMWCIAIYAAVSGFVSIIRSITSLQQSATLRFEIELVPAALIIVQTLPLFLLGEGDLSDVNRSLLLLCTVITTSLAILTAHHLPTAVAHTSALSFVKRMPVYALHLTAALSCGIGFLCRLLFNTTGLVNTVVYMAGYETIVLSVMFTLVKACSKINSVTTVTNQVLPAGLLSLLSMGVGIGGLASPLKNYSRDVVLMMIPFAITPLLAHTTCRMTVDGQSQSQSSSHPVINTSHFGIARAVSSVAEWGLVIFMFAMVGTLSYDRNAAGAEISTALCSIGFILPAARSLARSNPSSSLLANATLRLWMFAISTFVTLILSSDVPFLFFVGPAIALWRHMAAMLGASGRPLRVIGTLGAVLYIGLMMLFTVLKPWMLGNSTLLLDLVLAILALTACAVWGYSVGDLLMLVGALCGAVAEIWALSLEYSNAILTLVCLALTALLLVVAGIKMRQRGNDDASNQSVGDETVPVRTPM
eukprot:gnl/Dysnectes_brevis/2611_a3155_1221.p1 GENE.gnl/Dysnectes_brevis/2611_a3155_1221~~gnl/Dysnectes_brevis/2611_a3155_1221.p1  ORF type:complete len:786 (-),score=83.40 gnl/Dysnectes_brevis/2611_a3155_1221:93-2393(-)